MTMSSDPPAHAGKTGPGSKGEGALSSGMPKAASTIPAFAVDPFDPIRTERDMLAVFMQAADSFDARHGKSKAAARKQLQKEGIITPSGKLTERYGG